MKALLGKKIGMTQVFGEGDQLISVTAIQAGPVVVTQIKTEKKDGYSAVQVGFEEIADRKVNKPRSGHFTKAGVKPARYLAEIPVDNPEEYKPGQSLTAEIFTAGEKADVVGVSKGKGFMGVVKRWGFRGGPGSHGSHFHRAPGSIGMAATPSRVHKGKKMPGRLGGDKVTAKNLEIVEVDSENNIILVKGAVPGGKGNLVMIKASNS